MKSNVFKIKLRKNKKKIFFSIFDRKRKLIRQGKEKILKNDESRKNKINKLNKKKWKKIMKRGMIANATSTNVTSGVPLD